MRGSLLRNKKMWLPAFAVVLAACSATIELPPSSIQEPISESDSSEVDVKPNLDDDPFEGVDLRFSLRYWPDTDFSNRSIDLGEISSGGPPPDGIPAIDSPVFESVAEANTWLGPDWPIMFFENNGVARAYPLAILIHHEIVNDVVGDLPVSLTFCPLCNSTIAFDRRLSDGTVLDFGTTGNLRNSDLVMYDRQTRSWWQQFTGEAIVG